jgi:hypothetical protein
MFGLRLYLADQKYRLGMTIEDTIEAYKRFSKSVFYKRPLGGRFGKTVLALCGSPWYSAVELENSVKDVLQAAGVEITAPLRGSHEPGCRMYVGYTRHKPGEYVKLTPPPGCQVCLRYPCSEF